jgi:penicillin-binding protein 1A
MQLARNTYDIRAKSLHRKFLEIALTLRIESRYGKDEILTHYLNRIYFGAGAHGLEQAALTYFGRPARQLHEGECALLVGIIRGPSLFSPLRSLSAALDQRDQTLQRMVAMGMIDTARRDAIRALPIEMANQETRESQASYAFRGITRELNTILERQDIRRSGLEVHTTLLASWQERLERDLNQALRNIEKEKAWRHPTPGGHEPGSEPAYLQCAAVTLDTKTGGVMALIGGRDYLHSGYDRTASRRDLGPAFEPFVAAAAAERGRLVLPGRPVQTGRQVGPLEVQRIAKRCGFKGLASPQPDSEDIFRGAVSGTPMELAVGLATLGNKGRRPEPFFISHIKDAAGNVLFTREPDLTEAIAPHAADDGASVLKRHGSVRSFSGATGSERDAWALRLGPAGSTAIWIGFDKPTVITTDRRLKALLEEFITRLAN